MVALAEGSASSRDWAARRCLQSLLEQLRGGSMKTGTPMWCWLASAIAAATMIALAALYAVIVFGAGWLTLDYLVGHIRLLSAGAPWGEVLAYLLPGVVILLFLLLLIKPVFKLGREHVKPTVLRRKDEPHVFAYVERLCEVLGAPKPERIEVDLSVNASASFASLPTGLWRTRWVLTLGLPLIVGLDLPAFTGIVAHELGHFSQRRGMRVQLFIRLLNDWFARVVYQGDAFDAWMFRMSQPGLGPLRLPFIIGLKTMRLGRRILWVFMWMAHVASCLISRRAEYDADRHTAYLVGSDRVGSTLQCITLLDLAFNAVSEDLTESWRHGRLPDDVPALTVATAQRFSDERREQLQRLGGFERTRWSDTHPSISDRINAAKRLRMTGLIHSDEPAAALFRSLTDLCKRCTSDIYRAKLGEAFSEKNLVSAARMADEMRAARDAHKALRRVHGGEPDLTRPIFPTPFALTASADVAQARQDVVSAHDSLEDLGKELTKKTAAVADVENHLRAVRVCRTLVAAGLNVNPAEAGVRTLHGEGILLAVRELEQRRDHALHMLQPVQERIRQRMTRALLLLRQGELDDVIPQAERDALIARLDACDAAAAALDQAMPEVRQLNVWGLTMFTLIDRIGVEPVSRAARGEIEFLMRHTEKHLRKIRSALGGAAYPFEHIAGAISLADYIGQRGPAGEAQAAQEGPTASSKKGPPPHPAVERMFEVTEALQRVDGVVSRVLAVYAEAVERVEAALGCESREDPQDVAWRKMMEDMERGVTTRRPDFAAVSGGAGQLGAAALVAMVIAAVSFVTSVIGSSVPTMMPRHAAYQATFVPRDTWQHPPTWAQPFTPVTARQATAPRSITVDPRTGRLIRPDYWPKGVPFPGENTTAGQPYNPQQPYRNPYAPTQPNPSPFQPRYPTQPTQPYQSNRGYQPPRPQPSGGGYRPGPAPYSPPSAPRR